MLAAATQSPVWRTQGFVCLACRRAQIQAYRQQLRWNSQLESTPKPEAGDSWFDTLNDINDTYSDGQKTKAQKRRNLEHEEASTAKSSGRGAKTLKSDGLDKRVAKSKFPLNTKIEENHDQASPPSQGMDDATPSSTTDSRTKALRQKKAARIERRRAATKTTPPKRSKPDYTATKELEASSHGSGESISTLLPPGLQPEGHAKPSPQLQLLELVKQLQTLPEKKVSGKDARPAKQQSKAAFETSPVASVADPLPQNYLLSLRKVPSTSPLKDAKVPRTPSKSNSSVFGYLVERAHKHWKTWTGYGVRENKKITSAQNVSFNSLRKADRVSPEIVIASTFNAAPFGVSNSGDGHHSSGPPGSASEEKPSHPAGGDRESVPSAETQTASISASVEEPVTPESQETSAAEEPNNEAQMRLSNLYSSRHKEPDSKPAPSTPLSSKEISEIPKSEKPERVKRSSTRKRRSLRAKADSKNEVETAEPAAKSKRETQSAEPSGMSIADAMKAQPGPDAAAQDEPSVSPEDLQERQSSTEAVSSLQPQQLQVEPLDVPQPPVPYLQHGLSRVLFNPGVYQLQDPSSRVYNFDPYLQKIMPVLEFDFDSLKEYKTSSQDQPLAALAQEHGKKYIGSTSSMTSALAQFHYLLSNWRPLNLDMLSDGFVKKATKDTFTEINRAPSAIFLRYRNGVYAIDADKEYDSANVLMLLGKSMELLLTLPKDEYERYRKSDPRQVSEAQKTAPESYQYTVMNDLLMRSQLDAYDPRLPGNGTFDLKTRAVVSVRMDAKDFEPMTGYEIVGLHGKWGSYEREFYDMMRATMLKYMLQARMGRMNGIFVAYHNVKRIFGFQYLPLPEMDRALHGQTDTCLGDQEFRASLHIFNDLLNRATAQFPQQSLRLHFETRVGSDSGMPTALHVFAEPMSEDQIDEIQNSQKAKIAAFERELMGVEDTPAQDPEVNTSAFIESSVETVAESASEDEDASVAATLSSSDSNAESSADSSESIVMSESSTSSATASAQGDATAAEDDAHAPPDLRSSDSNADPDFLDSISTSAVEGLRPLFHATVILQSKINGAIPSGDRPKDLKPTDTWEIDFLTKEYETSRQQWAEYEDLKARRKFALWSGKEDADSDAESDGRDRKEASYISFLKELSRKGSELRGRIDEAESGSQVVRYCDGDNALPRHRERIDGVADYMAWLYNDSNDKTHHS